MDCIHEFQETVWNRIRSLSTTAAPSGLISAAESERFVNVFRYIFDLRYGQNAARVAGAFLGYRLASIETDGPPTLVEFAAALEIANTSITYIEDKVIDSDQTNQGGQQWAHVRFGLPLAIVVNSFVHSLSRKTFQAAVQLWDDGAPERVATRTWLLEQFENIFRDANYGQFLDIVYGAQLFRTSTDHGFFSDVDPCERTLSDHINALRTGQFVRRSTEFGCVVAGVKQSSDELRQLGFAMHLVGICVQDLNDLQDFLPTKGFPGSYGTDLLLLKKTFPVIWLLEHRRSIPLVNGLLNEIQDPSARQEQLVHEAREILSREGVFDQMMKRISRRVDRAQELLSTAFPSRDSIIELYFDKIRSKMRAVAETEPVHTHDA
jgi:geranylgeranyl pyrophosphate synthase